MNGFKPTIGIEFDDKYIDAKNKFIDFWKSLNQLSPQQRDCLGKECLEFIGASALYEKLNVMLSNK